MLGRVVTFMAGGWLTMSAFAWERSEAVAVNICAAGVLCIAYGLLSIFFPRARILNTVNACLVCLLSLSLEPSSAARANDVMVAAVIFGASLMEWPEIQGPRARSVDGSNASRTGLPCSPGGAG